MFWSGKKEQKLSTKHVGEISCPVCHTSQWWHMDACIKCGYLSPAWNRAFANHPWPLEPKYFEDYG
jgi:hypothetical protein